MKAVTGKSIKQRSPIHSRFYIGFVSPLSIEHRSSGTREPKNVTFKSFTAVLTMAEPVLISNILKNYQAYQCRSGEAKRCFDCPFH